MRAALLAAIVMVAICTAASAEGTKATLDFRDATLKQAIDDISQKYGVGIVADPKAQGVVTAHLEQAELNQALDVITKANKLSWKKMQFARQEDSKVSLDQLRSAALTLATMPLVGLTVEDPAAKKSALFAKDLDSTPDVASVALPEGYSWVTVYVVLAPESAAPAPRPAATAAAPSEKVQALSEAATQQMIELASLTPEDRRKVYQSELVAQMSMTPEMRRTMVHDRMHAIQGLDPQYRDQLRREMHWGGRRGGSRNRSSSGGNSRGGR